MHGESTEEDRVQVPGCNPTPLGVRGDGEKGKKYSVRLAQVGSEEINIKYPKSKRAHKDRTLTPSDADGESGLFP